MSVLCVKKCRKKQEVFSAIDNLFEVNMSFESGKSLRILLVEDNPTTQQIIGKNMERLKHSVTLANEGFEALDILTSQDFDLIILDVQMPDMDGFELCKLIRENDNERIRKIPIIGTSAGNIALREQCIDAGMDEYIPKPMQMKDFNNIIDKVLCD